jgi:hypothetical protein
MRAELLELDLLVSQIGLAGDGFGGHWRLLTLAFAKNWIVGGFLLSLHLIDLANCVGISLWVFAPAKQGGAHTAPRFALDVAASDTD